MKMTAFAALTAVGLSAASAQASSFAIDYQVAGDPFGSVNLFAPVTIDSEVYDGTFRAGQFNMTSEEMGNFHAFCVEITQALGSGHTYENAPDLLDADVKNNVDRLFSSAYDLVTDSVTAAGFQVALWEIVEDTSTGFDLSSGNFSAVDASLTGGSVVGTAQGFLDGLASASTGLFKLDYLGSATSQDLVTAQRAPTPVPLPAGGLLLLSVGLFLVRRNKR